MHSTNPVNTTISGINPDSPVRAIAVGNLHCYPGRALYVPEAPMNLLSVKQLCNNGWEITFDNDTVTLQHSSAGDKISGVYNNHTRMYEVAETCLAAITDTETQAAAAAEMLLYHRRYGHPGERRLRQLCAHIPGVDMKKWPATLPPCEACKLGKAHKQPVPRGEPPKNKYENLKPGQLICVDLIGPTNCPSWGGSFYILHALCAGSRMGWPELIKTKDLAAEAMAKILDNELAPTRKECEELHTDRGGEFLGPGFQTLCKERGIKFSTSPTDSPEFNGLIERRHRTTEETARALLLDARLVGKDGKSRFWGEAAVFADHSINQTPSRSLPGNKCPEEIFYGDKPRLGQLRVFGAPAVYYAPGGKFGPQAKYGIYLGPDYRTTGGAARIFCADTRRVTVTRNFKVDERPNCPIPAVLKEFYPGAQEHIPVPDSQPAPVSAQTSVIPDSGEILTEAPAATVITPTPSPPIRDPVDTDPEDEGFAEQNEAKPDSPIVSRAPSPDFGHEDPATNEDAAKAKRKRLMANKLRIDAVGFENPPTGRRRPRATSPDPEPGEEDSAYYTHASISLSYITEKEGERALYSFDIDDPTTYRAAMQRDDAERWGGAITAELLSLYKKLVFTIVLKTHDMHTVTCKWVFKLKRDEFGTPTKYKARLCARGFTQVEGRDYFEITAPVMRKESLRTILALAATLQYDLFQFDIETAYLNAPLDQEIYMTIPSGFTEFFGEHLTPEQRALIESNKAVLRLNRALYGLKQSGRCWYYTFSEILQKCGFQATETDPCIFLHAETKAILGIHVDDGILLSPDAQTRDQILSQLEQHLQLQRLGWPKHFLGWSIARESTSSPNDSISTPCDNNAVLSNNNQPPTCALLSVAETSSTCENPSTESENSVTSSRPNSPQLPAHHGLPLQSPREPSPQNSKDTPRMSSSSWALTARATTTPWAILLHQAQYIKGIDKVHGDGRYIKHTPMGVDAVINPNGKPADQKQYQSIIGSLNFAACSTRPDISTAVSILSRHLQKPTTAHVSAARNIIAYLNGTADMGIRYKQADGITIEVYSDASFAPREDDCKSRSGWVVLFNGAPVHWSSKLQTSVARSTAEAEYIALSTAATEAQVIQQLITELGFNTTGPIILHEDNRPAINMATEIATKQSRTVDVAFHHVRDIVKRGLATLTFCETNNMIADALTKPLPRHVFCAHRDRLMARGSVEGGHVLP